ncbi:MAG: hypothetical protein ACRESR_02885, partial [Gammaproteobacteria bacterium]
MANIALPAFPARSAGVRFVKGLANNGTVPSAAQYVTFGHSFQIGELARGSGLGANFGGGSVPCQVDAKTSFEDGSVAHAIVTVRAPSVAAGATAWGQFSAAAAPAGSAMSLGTALGSTTLSLALAPTPLPDWAASAAEPPGALTQPTAANPGGFLFQCTVAGTTGAAEPTAWPQSVGTTISDGAATWT